MDFEPMSIIYIHIVVFMRAWKAKVKLANCEHADHKYIDNFFPRSIHSKQFFVLNSSNRARSNDAYIPKIWCIKKIIKN